MLASAMMMDVDSPYHGRGKRMTVDHCRRQHRRTIALHSDRTFETIVRHEIPCPRADRGVSRRSDRDPRRVRVESRAFVVEVVVGGVSLTRVERGAFELHPTSV